MSKEPGPEIGRGRASVIYDMGDGTVLRRYLNATRSAKAEAALMRLAGSHGVPVPDVHATHGPDIQMAYVPGPSMLTLLVEQPDRAADFGDELVGLHRRLDGVRSESGNHSLVHGDLHPGNVIMSPRGPVLLDWTNAQWADRALDVALTWLILACFQPPSGTPALEMESAPRRQILKAFVDAAVSPAVRAALPRAAEIRTTDPATSRLEITRISALCSANR